MRDLYFRDRTVCTVPARIAPATEATLPRVPAIDARGKSRPFVLVPVVPATTHYLISQLSSRY